MESTLFFWRVHPLNNYTYKHEGARRHSVGACPDGEDVRWCRHLRMSGPRKENAKRMGSNCSNQGHAQILPPQNRPRCRVLFRLRESMYTREGKINDSMSVGMLVWGP